VSALFQAVNRGKRSLALNLKSDGGRELLLELLRDFDVIVEGFRPGVMDRLGLGDEVLAAANPRLIRLSISSWGAESPWAAKAGHDLNFVGMTGFLAATGNEAGAAMPGTQIGDIAGGALFPALAVLSALMEREKTGVGRRLDMSMTDGMAALCIPTQLLGESGVRAGGVLNGGLANYQIYACADGRELAVGSLEAKFWLRLIEKIGVEDLPELAWAPGPPHPEVTERMKAVFASKPQCEWLEILEDEDVCVTPVLSPEEVGSHPVFTARGYVVELTDGYRFVAPPVGTPSLGETRAAGEDTEAILSEAGFSEERLAELRASGAVP